MNQISAGIPSVGRPYGLNTMWIWFFVLALVWFGNWLIGDTASPSMNPYFFSILMYSGINVILAVSLNLVNGFTGQFSIGHAGFMAVGAYTAALITTTVNAKYPEMVATDMGQTFVFVPALIAGGIMATAVSYIVGIPSLRLRGDYLAIVTLGFGEIIRVVLLNMDVVGGARGMPGIPLYSSFGWVFTFVTVTIFCVWRTIQSSHGRVLLAVREDEIAAEAMGVNTTQGKVRAFTMGAFFAGIAGGLFAHFLRFLNTSIFDFNRSFEIIIMVVLGGMGSITGSVVAALLLTVLRELLRPQTLQPLVEGAMGIVGPVLPEVFVNWVNEVAKTDFRMIIYSLVLLILMLTRPSGLFGNRELIDFLPRKWRLRMGYGEAMKQ